MPKQEGQKSKLLTLLRILEQKTDEEHLLGPGLPCEKRFRKNPQIFPEPDYKYHFI